MIPQTSGTNGANNNAVETPKRKDQLGRDAFLQLLTTQLAHQDHVTVGRDRQDGGRPDVTNDLEGVVGAGPPLPVHREDRALEDQLLGSRPVGHRTVSSG